MMSQQSVLEGTISFLCTSGRDVNNKMTLTPVVEPPSQNVTALATSEQHDDSTSEHVIPKTRKKREKSANVVLAMSEQNDDSTSENVISKKRKKSEKSASAVIATFEQNDASVSEHGIPMKRQKREKSSTAVLATSEQNDDSTSERRIPKKRKRRKKASNAVLATSKRNDVKHSVPKKRGKSKKPLNASSVSHKSKDKPKFAGDSNTADREETPDKNKFMSANKSLDVMLNAENPCPNIPLGKKDNTYFIITNTNKSSKIQKFPDDCGIWDSSKGTTINQSYALSEDNKLTTIYFKNGAFCMKKKVSGKDCFKPCEPQPKKYITFHKYYTTLKGDEGYKKRVTIVADAPGDLQNLKNIALVEYCGVKTSAVNQPHGNSKKQDPYIRTNPLFLEQCVEQAKSKPVSDVCFLAAIEDITSCPKLKKQIRDKVYREKKKEIALKKLPKKIDCEVLEIISQLHTNKYIQKVEVGKQNATSIMLYSDEQILDLVANCTGGDISVVVIEPTFSVGDYFITPVVYKNQNVVHTETKENPTMLGPVLVHQDCEMITYHSFFAHLVAKIGDGKVVIGTDEEDGMTTALHDCFYNATFLLCTYHMIEDLKKFLEKSGVNHEVVQQIISIIFAQNGIVHSKDDLEYCTRVLDLVPYLEQSSKLRQYWEKYLERQLQEYVIGPLRQKIIASVWMRDKAEFVHQRFRQIAELKQCKLQDLIEQISLVTKVQMVDVQKALIGCGNLQLAKQTKSLKIDENCWDRKTDTMKEKLFKKFLTGRTSKKKSNKNQDALVHDNKKPDEILVWTTEGNFKCVMVDAHKLSVNRKGKVKEKTD